MGLFDGQPLYSEFCSSLSIACPEGLIRKDEVPDPFGLLYVLGSPGLTTDLRNVSVKWQKKPKRFQRREGLAWLYQYVKVIEKELPRGSGEAVQRGVATVWSMGEAAACAYAYQGHARHVWYGLSVRSLNAALMGMK